MAPSRIEDFFAFEAAVEFKKEVHRLVRATPEAYDDRKYRRQLWDAADSIESDMAEGFQRFNPSEQANFLRYALSSLVEATRRLRSGITRGYFSDASCSVALRWAERCSGATKGWLASQIREARRRSDAAARERSRRAPGRRRPSG